MQHILEITIKNRRKRKNRCKIRHESWEFRGISSGRILFLELSGLVMVLGNFQWPFVLLCLWLVRADVFWILSLLFIISRFSLPLYGRRRDID